MQYVVRGGGNNKTIHPLYGIFVESVFWLLVVGYAILVASWANFSVIDDHTFIKTLFIGEHIPFFISVDGGRFYPLDGQEWNVLSYLFSPNAKIFYAFNALCLIVVVWCLRYALLRFVHSYTQSLYARYVVYGFILLCIFSPTFITAWLRLYVPERMEFVFFSLFLACYMHVVYTHANVKSWIMLALGVVCANFALYYKETAFVMLGAFGFMHFILGYKQSLRIHKVFDIALVASSVVWLLVYIIVVVAHKHTTGSYGDTPYNQLLVMTKVIFTYVLQEPFLFVAVPLFVLYRIFMVLSKKSSCIPLLDASLVAALVLCAEYIVLKIGDIHYPLPAYIFGLVGLVGMGVYYWRQRIIRVIYIVCLVLYISNSIFVSAYQFAFYKVVPNNFQDTLGFLSAYTKDHPNTHIYLEGVNRASGVEVYHSFGSWLKFYGAEDFDLYSDTQVDNILLGKEEPNSPYSVFRSNAIVPKQSGDIVILTPYTLLNITQEQFKEFEQRYELLHISDFGYEIPRLGIKAFIKAFMHNKGAQGEVMLNQNIYGLPLYFYIYKVR